MSEALNAALACPNWGQVKELVDDIAISWNKPAQQKSKDADENWFAKSGDRYIFLGEGYFLIENTVWQMPGLINSMFHKPNKVKSVIRGGTQQDKRAALEYLKIKLREAGRVTTMKAVDDNKERVDTQHKHTTDWIARADANPDGEDARMLNALLNSPLAKGAKKRRR